MPYYFFWFHGRARTPDKYAEKIAYPSTVSLKFGAEDLEHDMVPYFLRLRLGAEKLDDGNTLANFLVHADGAVRLFESTGKVGSIVGPFLVPTAELAPHITAESWYRNTDKATHAKAMELGFRYYHAIYDARYQIWPENEQRFTLRTRMAQLKKLAPPKSLSRKTAQLSRSSSES